MIDMTEACERLAALSPAIARENQKRLADWAPELPPPTTRMAGFARALADAWSEMSEDTRGEVFNTIETLLLLGDELVQTSVTTGFLENLLNIALKGQLERKTVETLMGPASLEYFQEWDQYSANMRSSQNVAFGVGHTQKARDGIRELEKWLTEHPSARPRDRAAAENALTDLRNALNGQ